MKIAELDETTHWLIFRARILNTHGATSWDRLIHVLREQGEDGRIIVKDVQQLREAVMAWETYHAQELEENLAVRFW